MRIWASLLAVGAVGACRSPSPEAALSAYAEALRAGDASALHRRTDPSARATLDDVAAALTRTGTAARVRADALEGTPVTVFAEGRASDGRLVRLVWRGGAWRVARGGLELASAETPEAALEALWRAVDAGRLDDVRALMPAEARARWTSDAALSAHLLRLEPRLEAARAALGPLGRGRARTDGDRARLPYGDGRSVRWVREAGAWRVVDVE